MPAQTVWWELQLRTRTGGGGGGGGGGMRGKHVGRALGGAGVQGACGVHRLLRARQPEPQYAYLAGSPRPPAGTLPPTPSQSPYHPTQACAHQPTPSPPHPHTRKSTPMATGPPVVSNLTNPPAVQAFRATMCAWAGGAAATDTTCAQPFEELMLRELLLIHKGAGAGWPDMR